MASVRRRHKCAESRSSRLNPPAKTPKFFKIIVDPRAHMLRIPAEFARKFGAELPNRVVLRVPNGPEFRAELVRSEGETWLDKGWEKFQEHYSIGFGQFLVFEYDLKSCFYVHIFGMDAAEIEHSLIDANVQERTVIGNNRGDDKLPKMETIGSESESDDDSDMLSEEPMKKEKGKGKILADQEESGGKKKGKRPRADDYHNVQTRKSVPGTKNLSSIGKSDSRLKPSYQNSIGKKFGKGAVDKETSPAYKRAKAFKSDNPSQNLFFISLMQPAYISAVYPVLTIPLSIAREILPGKKCGEVKLCVSDGKMWRVTCSMDRRNAKFTGGWKCFVDCSGLKVGDACVFEVNMNNKLLLNVTIFRC